MATDQNWQGGGSKGGAESASGAAGSVSEFASKAADTARQAVSQASDAIKGATPKDAARIAQQGGEYAYNTVTSHPVATAALGALAAYLIFGRGRSNDYYQRDIDKQYRRARDTVSDYADRARNQWGGYDVSDAMSVGRDYASRIGNQAAHEPLAAAVGVGLLAWMVGSFLSSNR
ncbi:hypothetical protein [Alsobacter sp. SYSU BS001988]|jgi:hypothetical protein